MIDRISLWVLCLGAFAIPLVYLRDTHDEFVLPKLLFAHGLLVLLLALHAARWAAGGVLAVRRTSLDLPILAFLASALVATIFSVNRNVAIFGTYIRYEGLLTLATYAGLFWLAAQTAWRSDRAQILMRSLLIGAYVVSVIAVVQWVIADLATTVPTEASGFGYAGFPRASATLSNPTMLGAFLAMLLPVGVAELLEGRPLTHRIWAANVVFMMALALALSFARSAWLGAIAGLVIAIAAPQRTPLRERLALCGAGIVLVLAVLAGAALAGGRLSLIPSLLNRVVSIETNLTSATPSTGSIRIRTWEGTIPLIASRPIEGYGPDTFGMVYPRFRTGDWTPGFVTDKAHSEPLQIGATQGVLGVASYLWILGASGLAFWRGRRNLGAAGAVGGVVAYQVWALTNFSWLPAAVPYWLFLAAAVGIWKGELPATTFRRVPRPVGAVSAVIVGLALLGLAATNTASEWSADAHYAAALAAEARGDLSGARTNLAQARVLAPEQAWYATEAGRLALTSKEPGQARWVAAEEAYSDAARLGTYYSAVYYNLALSELHLNRRAEAIAALHRALDLSPGDPATLALLRQVSGA